MTADAGGNLVPQWTLGDRLTKARKLTGMTAAEFADVIGVSERTVNNAEGDKRAVRPITLNAWALATGVSRRWLETGEGVMPNPPSGRQEARGPAAGVKKLIAEKQARNGRSDGDNRTYDQPLAA